MMLQTYADAHGAEWKPGKPDRFDIQRPDEWTPEWVGVCLIAAFKIDRRMPKIERPKDPGSAHPQIEYSREEMEEWETTPIVLERLTPSRKEIAKMETVFRWLDDVRAVNVKDALVLRGWGVRRAASGGSDRAIARKMGIDRETLERRRDRSLKLVCSRLTEDGTVVF